MIFGQNYGPIFREGQPLSAALFNDELSKCIVDIHVAEGSGLTMSRFGRRVTIGVGNRSGLADGAESVWVRIESSTVVDAGQEWTYTIIPQKFGGGAIGLEDESAATYTARNTWEQLVKAGYENVSVEELYPIPNDAIVRAWRLNASTYIFAERNEPNCEPAE